MDVSIPFFLHCVTVTVEYITTQKDIPKSPMFFQSSDKNRSEFQWRRQVYVMMKIDKICE